LKKVELTTASFCGFVADSDDLQNVKDINKTIVKFGWTLSHQMHGANKVRLGLLRAKALSLLHELPHCPILSQLALRYAELTVGVKPRFDDNWSTQLNLRHGLRMSDASVGLKTRLLVQNMFGISMHEQVVIEKAIREIKSTETPLPSVVSQCVARDRRSEQWKRYYEGFRYVKVV
jgi:hypothetical protein